MYQAVNDIYAAVKKMNLLPSVELINQREKHYNYK